MEGVNVGDNVGNSVGDMVGDSSVGSAVDSVGDSVGNSVGEYERSSPTSNSILAVPQLPLSSHASYLHASVPEKSLGGSYRTSPRRIGLVENMQRPPLAERTPSTVQELSSISPSNSA